MTPEYQELLDQFKKDYPEEKVYIVPQDAWNYYHSRLPHHISGLSFIYPNPFIGEDDAPKENKEWGVWVNKITTKKWINLLRVVPYIELIKREQGVGINPTKEEIAKMPLIVSDIEGADVIICQNFKPREQQSGQNALEAPG